MLKILKNNLKKSWWAIVLIFVLLCTQAMADLNLPDFTSKIVNVGIQQKGVENSSPEVITKSTMDKILLLTKEDELILNNYQIFSRANVSDKEYNKYLKKYPNIEKQETYVIKKVDDETRDKLNIEMGKAFMLVGMLSNEDAVNQLKEQMSFNMNSSNNTEDNNETQELGRFDEQIVEFNLIENQDIFKVISLIPDEKLNIILDMVNKRYSEMPDSIIEQSAILSVQKEYEMLGANLDNMQNNYILISGLKMLGVAMISMITAILITLLSARTAAQLGRTVREKVYKKVLSFSSNEYRKFGSSSLITRNTNDVQQIQNMVPMLFRTVIYAPIVGVGAFLKVLNQSENSMAWIIGVAIAVIIIVIGGLFGLAMPKFKKLQDLIDKLNMVSREILTGIPVIRAFNKEKFEENRFDEANTDLTKTIIFVNRTMSFMMPVLMFIMNGMSLLIIWNGAGNVDKGVMQVGTVMTFMQYSMQVVISFLFISMLSIMLPRASVSARRVNDVLETENLVKDAENLKQLDSNKKGLVEFRDVSFRYPDADSEVLTDINFVAKPGEVTAIIGSTGSGKSTVVNLLPRFYDVTAGEILVDGVNIKDVSQKDLRDVIGFVPQKGVLFSGTIESNIKFSDEDMSDEKMVMAAEIAQAKEFISSKENTYKSEISQGGNNVSGGQKQRLSIARAITKDPEIFVFDDSFSALDFKTDLKLRTALEKVTQDKTVIIVAQRISTIMNASQIIVLDEGKIVGKGTHEELMDNCDVYRQIALSQLSQGELEA
ncbi:MAG: ABC transporter ATP-binding protein [Clostridia bacterium]|nr:ABC transporter ATP-binding protein [Clostridia bacterium]